MKGLNQLTIRSRLLIVFGVCFVIFIVFGAVTMVKVNQLRDVTQNIYHDPLKVSNAAIEAKVDIIKIHRDMKDLILSKDEAEIRQEREEIEIIADKVMNNLNEIKQQAVSKDTLTLEREAREIFLRWRESRQEVINLTLENQRDQAQNISKVRGEGYVQLLETKLTQIDENSKKTAYTLLEKAHESEKSLRYTLVGLMIGLAMSFILFFMLMIRSILGPIALLKSAMDNSVITGKLEEAYLEGENEITDISRYYNLLIKKLKDQFWIKDGQNLLNQEISNVISVDDLAQKALNFIARTVDGGKGALYLYHEEDKTLHLRATYAFTKKEQLSKSYALGEGIVGQVALEKRSILLKNIEKKENRISTGVLQEAPLNIYTFPLIFEDELSGVIELASFEPFDSLKQEFLKEAASIVAINLYSAIQNQKIKDLLETSEEAERKAKSMAHELQKTNVLLEEQQQLLQQQTEELQKSNVELEEQQQLLQQQSAELQQTNAQLEEQQQLLEDQSRQLNVKNQELEGSKQELVKYTEQLQLVNKYKSEFLANMSHELRTPLNSIILLSKLLIKNDQQALKEEDVEKISVIYDSGKELLRLINDILDLSKIEAGKMDLNVFEFPSSDLMRDLKQLFEKVAAEKKISLIMEDTIKGRIYGDREKIAQILRNLLSNALKFTTQGAVTLKMMLDTKRENGIVFAIEDTGIGIAQENLNRIFEEFQQGDGSISRKYGGTGLGLSISKKLAELMDGEIVVSSQINKGSIFSLHLASSAPSVESVSAITVSNAFQESAVTSEVEGILSNVNRRILLVEDDEVFARYIKKIIEDMGFEVLQAEKGADGLELVKQYAVDGVLLDLMLPDMSGIEVLQELKGNASSRSIPVHIISAWNKSNTPMKMGAVGYQQKPVEDRDILGMIRKIMHFSENTPRHLLILGNNRASNEAIEELQTNAMVKIQAVNTEEEAKLEIDRGIYDVILLDLVWREKDELNICKYLKDKNIETPVIIYTNQDLTLAQEQKVKSYEDTIIIKTVNSQERLLDEVTLFLHQIRKKKEEKHYLVTRTNRKHTLRLDGKKIMIVDDDPRNVFVLASALENFGAEIIEAENGEDALRKLDDQRVDLILMDIMMPVMDGYETMKAIRSNSRLQDIPTIAITAKSLKGDKEKCIAAGADDYISKPVDYDVLIQLVKAWIDHER